MVDNILVFFALEPCPPGGVSAVWDCQAGTAVVSWTPSANAANYTAKANSSNGSPVYCYGPNDTSTSCTLTGLECNQQYAVTVTASDEMCTSAESQIFDLDPGKKTSTKRLCLLLQYF